MMEIVFFLIIVKYAQAQVNGEFWWLNDKVKNINNFNEDPKFEDDDLEVDTSDIEKIVFRDFETSYTVPDRSIYKPPKNKVVYKNKINEKFTLPDRNIININVSKLKSNDTKANKNTNKDEFVFKYSDESPENDIHLNKTHEKYIELTKNRTTNEVKPDVFDRITFTFNKKDETVLTEDICTYILKEECLKKNGRVMEQMKTKTSPNQVMEQPTCCVIPLQKSVQERIHFPDSPKLGRPRITRSVKTKENPMGKSIHRIVTLPIPVKCSNIKAPEKIINDYDYDNPNPYWNIQNSDIRKQQTKLSRPVNFYGEDDYDSDYEIIDELPKPGLTGIYSDTEFRPSVFKPTALEVPEDIDFGYDASDRFPVLDPRLDTNAPNRQALKKPKRTKQTIESQTISYHSSPDFKVLQGFKLLNLMRDKTKINRNKRPSDDDEDSGLEVLLGDLKSESEESDVDENGNVYSNCGNVFTEATKEEEGDYGDVQYGTQPWLTLVLRKRKSQRMFCHATLVHPRAAFTSATCVYGYRPGDLELYAGVWNLMVDQKSQKRTASTLVHPKYSPGDLEHDIAILYWSQPLRLNKNVQPACLSDLQTSDDCMVVAWGKQSATRATPKWQRAPVVSEECDEVLNKYGMPESDLLCASAESKQCLANIGSPIICGSTSGKSAIGVVVTKDDCDMLIVPAHDWIQRSLARLRIVN